MFDRLAPPVDLEESVLKFWDEERIFERTLAMGEGRPHWVFYEGPPTANGNPHNGHVLTRVIKDVFPRYRTMRGFHVARKAGWDTHGLPVEVEVEKALGIHGRDAIQAFGLEAFAHQCVSSVFRYTREWERLTRQIGFWVDLDEAYVTYRRAYVESVWWALSRLFEKGLLYKGHKVVWWWPQGGTTLSAAEVGLGYKEVRDPAITIRFRDAANPSLSYLAWTTTPWTLPSNVALAVGEDIEYAFCDDPGADGEVVVAVALAGEYGLEPKRVVRGADLVGRHYEPLYDFGPAEGGRSFVIVPGHHVTITAGTGIVHTAPAFGEDDMVVARDQGLGLLQWVEPSGRFAAGTGFLAGRFCKDADPDIVADLEERRLLFRRETVVHEYPYCWRAEDDPLIQYARPAWFIRTTARIEEALANNAAVGWLPEHIKEGRFGDFLRNNVDWALSRERFWGTPLNIWECPDCEHRIAPASAAAIERMNPDAFSDDVDPDLQLHRPWIDRVQLPCPECGASMGRVPEVIDGWFDSGCMPFAQWGFPHANAEVFRESFPADFISEAVDQTRGWFYSLLMISTLLFDDETCRELGLEPVGFPRPYRNCIVLGLVSDMEGRKESKSKGNYTSPNLILRGRTQLDVLPDPTLQRGQVGLKSDQVRSLDLGEERVTLSITEEAGPDALSCQVVAANVLPKDTVHLHPDDLAALGLPEEGGALWFRIPAEPPGADAFRWLFASANPPWSNTRLSMRAVRDAQREFLIRLRNVYQFFAIYANIAHEQGNFEPISGTAPPPGERSELDRWILHRLHETVDAVTRLMDAYLLYDASRSILLFVDDLSNWYVRRSRARFWGEGKELSDALWTLYEVLQTLTRLIAPFVPFTAEALYRELVRRGDVPTSVHMDAWPTVDPALVDDALGRDMALVRELASLGLSARASARIKVRQPLVRATVVLADPSRESVVLEHADVLKDELNVKEIELAADAAVFVSYVIKPDFRRLGPRLGKDVKRVAAALASMDGGNVKRALDTGRLDIDLGDRVVSVDAEDVVVRVEQKGEYEAASSPTAVVALSTKIDDDLRAEGLVRELVSRVQALRRDLDLGYTQRIALEVEADPEMLDALQRFGAYLRHETLATELRLGVAPGGGPGWTEREWDVDGHAVRAAMLPR